MRSARSRFGQLFKILFVLLLLGATVLAVTPLKLYYSHVNKYFKPVTLSGINGSLVKGGADELKYMTMSLGQAEWLLYPKSHKSLGGQVKVAKDNYDLTFDIKKVDEKVMWIETIEGFVDWQLFKQFLQLRYGQLTGYAQMNLKGIRFTKESGLERLEGSVLLKDFKLVQPISKELGLVKVEFETKSKGMIVGQFSSESAVLNVSGTLFLQPRRWQLNLDIIPRGGNFEMDAVLSSVGQARSGGGRKLNLAGFY